MVPKALNFGGWYPDNAAHLWTSSRGLGLLLLLLVLGRGGDAS